MRIALRLAIIVLGTVLILLIGSLLWFGLNPQRSPASFPTSTLRHSPQHGRDPRQLCLDRGGFAASFD